METWASQTAPRSPSSQCLSPKPTHMPGPVGSPNRPGAGPPFSMGTGATALGASSAWGGQVTRLLVQLRLRSAGEQGKPVRPSIILPSHMTRSPYGARC